MTAQQGNITIIGHTVDGRPVQSNQAELLKQYRAELAQLKHRTLKTILHLQEKYKKLGMVI